MRKTANTTEPTADRVVARYLQAEEFKDAPDVAVEQCEIAMKEAGITGGGRDWPGTKSKVPIKAQKAKAIEARAEKIEAGRLLPELKNRPKFRAHVVEIMRARAKSAV